MPADIVAAIHGASAGTRGAAVAVLAADRERGVARFCGLGNISGAILPTGPTARRHLVSLPGTAGVGKPRLTEFQYPFSPDDTLVLHSGHPSLIAAVLFRDFGRRRDDATAVVIKERPRA